MRKIVLPVLLASAVAGAIWLIHSEPSPHTALHAQSLPSIRNEQAMATAQTNTTSTIEQPLAELPPSLQGTTAPSLSVDEAGHWVVSIALRNVFDYFLSAQNEESMPIIQQRIAAYLKTQLPPQAQTEALQILEQYLAYRQALVDFEKLQYPRGEAPASDMSVYFKKMRNLRLYYFSPVVNDAFFHDEDAYNDFTVGRAEITNTPSLSPTEKQQKLADLEQNLPETLRTAMTAANKPLVVADKIEQLRASGADAETIRQARIDMVGAEAAARLDALDKQRADWQARVDDYHNYQRNLLATAGVSDSDKQALLKQWLEQRFSATEQLRLSAIEHLSAIERVRAQAH